LAFDGSTFLNPNESCVLLVTPNNDKEFYISGVVYNIYSLLKHIGMLGQIMEI
jgi:hypothetical protein